MLPIFIFLILDQTDRADGEVVGLRLVAASVANGPARQVQNDESLYLQEFKNILKNRMILSPSDFQDSSLNDLFTYHSSKD